MALTDNFDRCPLGLYRVHWKSGGYSLAAIGMAKDGTRWIAPTNWVQPSLNINSSEWAEIDRLEPMGDGNLMDALEFATGALRKVGDDYPGSSCQKWCHEQAEEAETIAYP
jgi:hypothetical protein